MKHIANIITVARTILSVVLLLLSPLSAVFFIIYALCGFTDMIDGTVARRLGSASHFGALLDSTADIVFVICAGIRLIPVLYPLFPKWWIYPIIAILFMKTASIIIGAIKFRKLCFLHTILNKFTGITVFILPFCYSLKLFPVLIGIVCGISLFAAAEEFLCIIKAKEYKPNINSIFS